MQTILNYCPNLHKLGNLLSWSIEPHQVLNILMVVCPWVNRVPKTQQDWLALETSFYQFTPEIIFYMGSSYSIGVQVMELEATVKEMNWDLTIMNGKMTMR